MRRMISLFMATALLSVTSLPLLPQAAVCHALENNADCETCHSQEGVIHNEHTTTHERTGHAMQHDNSHDMHSSMMHHDAPAHKGHDEQLHHQPDTEQAKGLHKHQKQLSAAERECRIECGCGCNRSVDGFPQVLSPHVIPTAEFESGERTVRIEPGSYPVLQSLIITTPPPPPKHI